MPWAGRVHFCCQVRHSSPCYMISRDPVVAKMSEAACLRLLMVINPESPLPGAGCCDPWNDKALKASRGAHLGFPLAQGSMDDLLSVLGTHGLRALAAAVPSQDLGSGEAQSTGSWLCAC